MAFLTSKSQSHLSPRWQIGCNDRRMFAGCDLPLSWGELVKRTAKESSGDDVLGLAAQLAYSFFLALFPAILFLLAVASFFPLTNLVDDLVGGLRPVAPRDVLSFLEDQLKRVSNADSGGILTIGILGAIRSSSAAVVAIIGSLQGRGRRSELPRRERTDSGSNRAPARLRTLRPCRARRGLQSRTIRFRPHIGNRDRAPAPGDTLGEPPPAAAWAGCVSE